MKIRRKTSLFTLLAGLGTWILAAEPTHGATFVVPTDFPTIQGAIDASQDGDTVLVRPGTYFEVLTVQVGITIRSTDGATTTIVDGTGLTSSVITTQNSNRPVLIEGLTVRGGEGSPLPTCLAPDVFPILGGGLYAFGVELTIRDCRFVENGHAVHGVYAGGAAYFENSIVRIENTEFRDNGREVNENNQVLFGAGIAACGFPEDIVIDNCLFQGNGRAGFGGGMFLDSSNGLNVLVTNTTFHENRAAFGGGSGVLLRLGGTIEFNECNFDANTASHGGGLWLSSITDGFVTCLNSTFSRNDGSHGGGIRISTSLGGDILLAGILCYRNRSAFGGGINASTSEGGTITILNTTTAGNNASHGSGLYGYVGEAGSIQVSNSILRDGTSVSNNVLFTSSNLPGGLALGGGNFDANPQFRNSGANDFRLSYGSSSIDSGNNGIVPPRLAIDLDGGARIHDGDADGNGIVDLGAYEYHGNPRECSPGTVNAGAGAITDVLLVNGSAGNALRNVTANRGDVVTFDLQAAPAGSGSGRNLLWVWRGEPQNAQDLVANGSPIGCFVNPTPILLGLNPQPTFCLRSSGIPPVACSGTNALPQSPVPWSVTNRVNGRLTVTIQGLIEDLGSAHPTGFSATNAVTLIVP